MQPDEIKALRKRFNLSQDKFAKLLGVKLYTVQRWEAGKTKPSPLAMKALKTIDRKKNLRV